VQQANAIAPAYSKIYKEMILIALPSKPLQYGSKGHVLRKSALDTYQQEIDDL
jgi:hypothetical protein